VIRVQLAALLAIVCVALFAASGRLRFLSAEFTDWPRRLVASVLLVAILAAAVFYPAAAGEQLSELDLTSVWFPGLFFGHALLTGFLIAWWTLRGDQRLARFLHLDPLIAGDIAQGLWLGCMGWMMTILVTAAVAVVVNQTPAGNAPPQVPPFMIWIATLPLSRKLLIIAVAMTVEEAFFRGFLQPRVGWITSSLLFAASHASYGLPLMLVSVLVISLVMGWSFRRNNRLLPCIAAHGAFDAIQLLVIMPWAVRMLEAEQVVPA
jgi:membrane protease YdiL (CAAX protease family)